MIFVWGRKAVYSPAGYVADFCPVCRAARAFSVQRIGMAWHVYYITLSKGELAGYQRTCCDCGMALPMEAGHYSRLSVEQLPLAQLEQATNPHLSLRHADALAAAARLREAPLLLDESERRRQLDAALRLQADALDEYEATTRLDKEVWWSIGAAFAFCAAVLTVLRQQAPQNMDTGFIIAFFLSLGAVAWQLSQMGERFLQRSILPKLARSLAPLQPSQTELDEAFQRMGEQERKLAKRIDSARVQQAIAALRG
ncbi:hypothetical protein [Pseudoduganella violaceinigra]|uniref:hypothetical protein n=1 Tax=Pseudoduganella violaceinigra TaxID=246602 RepID=UPI000484BBB9|nr:hypothetical protein [Pseudoduganella violaceinigra]